ncbi:hypothetical protein GGR53DRAFT_529896 [Hypoxylon sp. FL1150]|nr:hypothetical protein GGR53DRAFT_529896 [Hypoxylon sp. FL1150]
MAPSTRPTRATRATRRSAESMDLAEAIQDPERLLKKSKPPPPQKQHHSESRETANSEAESNRSTVTTDNSVHHTDTDTSAVDMDWAPTGDTFPRALTPTGVRDEDGNDDGHFGTSNVALESNSPSNLYEGTLSWAPTPRYGLSPEPGKSLGSPEAVAGDVKDDTELAHDTGGESSIREPDTLPSDEHGISEDSMAQDLEDGSDSDVVVVSAVTRRPEDTSSSRTSVEKKTPSKSRKKRTSTNTRSQIELIGAPFNILDHQKPGAAKHMSKNTKDYVIFVSTKGKWGMLSQFAVGYDFEQSHIIPTYASDKNNPKYAERLSYKTAEHYLQEQKVRWFCLQNGQDSKNAKLKRRIRVVAKPEQAKALGDKVEGVLHERWEQDSIRVALMANVAKFKRDDLTKLLLTTCGKTIVQARRTDAKWGNGRSETETKEDIRQGDFSKWGGNRLGLVLMTIRQQLAKKFTEKFGLKSRITDNEEENEDDDEDAGENEGGEEGLEDDEMEDDDNEDDGNEDDDTEDEESEESEEEDEESEDSEEEDTEEEDSEEENSEEEDSEDSDSENEDSKNDDSEDDNSEDQVDVEEGDDDDESIDEAE